MQAGVDQGSGDGDGFAAAHARLMGDRTLQFSFGEPPKPPPPPPDWLEPLLRFFKFIAPAMPYLFWGVVIVGGLFLAWFVAREILGHRWRRAAPPLTLETGVAAWRPEPAQALALLAEADRMARDGRYAEAAHILLLRSIDDFRGRRPELVRPALTSRDIGALEGLPDSARPAFRLIAEVVERSLFGGRPVDADAFGRCRRAYEDFALPKAWA